MSFIIYSTEFFIFVFCGTCAKNANLSKFFIFRAFFTVYLHFSGMLSINWSSNTFSYIAFKTYYGSSSSYLTEFSIFCFFLISVSISAFYKRSNSIYFIYFCFFSWNRFFNSFISCCGSSTNYLALSKILFFSSSLSILFVYFNK